SIAKFPPQGGKFVYSDHNQLVEPLNQKPARAPDFKVTIRKNYKDFPADIWAEGMLWNFGSTLPLVDISCGCYQPWFSIDTYARSFVPEGSRYTVSVVDTNGNFILRMGGWGNCD